MNPHVFAYLAVVLGLGIAAQWLAWRLRLPSILLLLLFGFGARYFGEPDEIFGELLFPVVSLSVAVILFEGGLTLRFSELHQTRTVLMRLVTVGALVSWGLTTLAAGFTLGLDWRLATLLGAILVVTGPTVIGPLLRHVRPARKVGSIAKWEGIVIDPIGAILAVMVFETIVATSTGAALGMVATGLVKTVAVGIVLGVAAALLLVEAFKRYLVPDHLQNPFILALVLGVFVLSNWLQSESGLLTVTVMGILLANQKRVGVKHVLEFKENLQVLLISTLFIVLASRIDPQRMLNLGAGGPLPMPGLWFLGALLLVIRPASVLISTIGTETNWRERLFLACLAPRGIVAAAVSSIFALELLSHTGAHGPSESLAPVIEQAGQLVPATFLVIVGTVAIYGLLAGPLARWLGLAAPNPQGILLAGADPWVLPIAKAIHAEGFSVMLVDTNYDHTAQARMAGLNATCASILSEYVSEEMDLGGIGRLIAVTANDEVNALAVQEFSHVFGRANVYRLAPWDKDTGRRSSSSGQMSGRLAFGAHVTYADMAQRHGAGETIKRTRLTEEFSYEDFLNRYGDSAQVLMVIESPTKLRICTSDEAAIPTAGHTLIAMVTPKADSAPAEPSPKSAAT